MAPCPLSQWGWGDQTGHAAPVLLRCFRGGIGPGALGTPDDGVQPLAWHHGCATGRGGFIATATGAQLVDDSAHPRWESGRVGEWDSGRVGEWDREGSSPRALRCAVAPELSPETEVGIVLPQLQVQ